METRPCFAALVLWTVLTRTAVPVWGGRWDVHDKLTIPPTAVGQTIAVTKVCHCRYLCSSKSSCEAATATKVQPEGVNCLISFVEVNSTVLEPSQSSLSFLKRPPPPPPPPCNSPCTEIAGVGRIDIPETDALPAEVETICPSGIYSPASNDAFENVRQHMLKNATGLCYWIGAARTEIDGQLTYQWLNGQPMNVTAHGDFPFGSGDPSFAEVENCFAMYSGTAGGVSYEYRLCDIDCDLIECKFLCTRKFG